MTAARMNRFPLFARGISPIPGAKKGPREINGVINGGGVTMSF